MLGPLLAGAIWVDFRAYWAGVGALYSRTPKPDFSPARQACAHAHGRAPPVARPKRNGRRHAAGGPGAVARLPSRWKIIIRTSAFVESLSHGRQRQWGGSSSSQLAAVCDAHDLMGEVGLAEGVSSVALLVSK
jgi:hypothetical protein